MRKIVLFVALMVALLPLCAQEQPPRPTLLKITFPQSAAINALSDNGSWAAASGVGEDQSEPAYPYLVNAVDGSLTELWDDDNPVQGGISANDVTDDGQIVVGSYGGRPAFCNTATKTWTTLACDDGGVAEKVTPDGRYIAGWGASSSFSADNYSEVPLLWERQADGSYRRVDVVNELTGFPTQDKTGANTNMLRIENMSADGNILAGAINFIYPAVACYYVYNRTTHETYYIDNAMTGVAEGSFVDQSVMSNNGAYMSGIMQLVISDGDEYAASYLYATADNGLTMYNVDAEEQDRGGYAVTNSGLVLASSPAVNPLRSVYVRHNSLWFGLDELLYSRYGINYYEQTGYEYTGIVCGVSDDEKVIAGMALTQTDGYIIRLQEPLATAAAGVNPLEAYAVSPAAGSQFARFRSVTLAFSKKVTLAAGVGAQLLDEEGNLLRPYTITPGSDGRTFTIGGRPQSLEQDKRYTLRIPAGAFTLTQDNAFSSEEINITYVGRDEQPVAMLQAAPADGANVSELGVNNPVQMAFDTEITVAQGAVGYLYEEGNETPVCEMQLISQGNILTLTPNLARYLTAGRNYRVVLPAGAVTDIMGDCGNEEITLRYVGIFEPEFDIDGNLFFDDFNNPSVSMATYLLYEGDHRQPVSAMADLDFDADNNPWNFTIREDLNSTDYFAASHSSYSPAGASDDWMSLPRLFIENADYHLTFDAQSYRAGKTDRLQVVVLEEPGGYTRFTDELYAKFEAEGVTIYDEQLSPGASEEGIAGEWQTVDLSLAQFEGKSIYIAFVNRNEDQSMVFVDNIRVHYSGDFYFAPTGEENVVARESAPIAVQLRVTGDKTYNDLSATLTTADGSYTQSYSATGLGLTKDSPVYRFAFPGEMPLQLGRENNYTVTVSLDGKSVSRTDVIRNLAFETTKHVVVEEGTGQWCGNCPLGLLALDNLKRLYDDRVIAIGVHGGTGFDSYLYPEYTSYLGFTAWPAGRVNRIDTIYAPMYTADGGYEFASPEGNKTFLDIAQRELSTVAYADVRLTGAVCNAAAGTMTLSGEVAYALDLGGVNHNLAFVVVENGLTGPQTNYFYITSHPNLGEFGQGGQYATSMPSITLNDVARSVPGNVFAGVPGLVPVSVSSDAPVAFSQTYALPENVADWNNAELVAMLIDANTGRVVNAAKLPFTTGGGTQGIGDVAAQGAVSFAAGRGSVSVSGAHPGASVELYDAAGRRMAAGTADGAGCLTLPTGGTGVYVVRVGQTVGKVLVD